MRHERDGEMDWVDTTEVRRHVAAEFRLANQITRQALSLTAADRTLIRGTNSSISESLRLLREVSAHIDSKEIRGWLPKGP